MSSPFRVVIFTTDATSQLVRTTLVRLLERIADCDVLVIERVQRRGRTALARSQIRNLKRHGWRWLVYQTQRAAGRFAKPTEDAKHSKRIAAFKSAIAIYENARVRRVTTASVNSPETVGAVKNFNADLGISLSAPILRPDLFNAPRLGTINLHQGKLPEYRGMPPAFWEIANNEASVGVTVHRIAEGLDTGDILIEASIPRERFATPDGIRVRLDDLGSKMIVDTAEQLRTGKIAARPQANGGRTNTRPTLAHEAQVLSLVRPPRTARTIAKSSIFSSYARLGTLARRGSDSVVVLLYHRVTDALRDNVTIGVERFRDQIAYLSDHHHVVDLKDLLAGPQQAGNGPIVAITFDDGYLDNYEYAAPVLTRYGMPATFFVSTTIVDQSLPFQHDLTMYGHGLPTMTWAQMREMQAAGFNFGGHTANHVNMAHVDDSTAHVELETSKFKLAEELGITAPMFAYCFGKRADFTQPRLAQVKALGYSANCSAYGGVNGLDVDRWDIRRQGIDWQFDVPALRARLYGWGKDTLR